MTHFDPSAELDTLKADLADAQKRYKEADREGRRYLEARMKEIQRDIRRNTKKIRDNSI